MAIIKIQTVGDKKLVAFGANFSAKDLEKALVADSTANKIYNNDKKEQKIFEFNTVKEGIECLSTYGVVVKEHSNRNSNLSTLFDCSAEDLDKLRYQTAMILEMMTKVEKQVADACKKVDDTSKKVVVENLIEG